jgi:hypothetical protein
VLTASAANAKSTDFGNMVVLKYQKSSAEFTIRHGSKEYFET